MSLALKYHHRERLKKNRRHHWGRDLSNDPKALSQAITTPAPCSCFGCANKRKHEGETLQEKRSAVSLKEFD